MESRITKDNKENVIGTSREGQHPKIDKLQFRNMHVNIRILTRNDET
jgi:hypothetical protein